MQNIGKGANFVVHLVGELGGIRQSFAHVEAGTIETFRQMAKGHDQHREFLPGSVVKVAGHLTAFLILNLQDTGGKSAEGGFRLPQPHVRFDEFGDFVGHDADDTMLIHLLEAEREADGVRSVRQGT